MDDFRGSCGKGHYPLISAVTSVLNTSKSLDILKLHSQVLDVDYPVNTDDTVVLDLPADVLDVRSNKLSLSTSTASSDSTGLNIGTLGADITFEFSFDDDNELVKENVHDENILIRWLWGDKFSSVLKWIGDFLEQLKEMFTIQHETARDWKTSSTEISGHRYRRSIEYGINSRRK